MKKADRQNRIFIFLGILIIGFVLINMWNYNETNSVFGSETQKSETQKIENITPKDAYKLIEKHKDNENFIILDVRTPGEFKQGYIKNAKNIDYYSETFRDELNKLDKDKTYLIYCRSGNRSGRTLRVMQELDYSTVYNITGGILQWYAEGLPITK